MQEEHELAEQVDIALQACSDRIRQKYADTRETRWTADVCKGAWVRRQIAHTLQKWGYKAAQQATYNLEQALYQFDVVRNPRHDNPNAVYICGKLPVKHPG